jgi:hypothetical protein
VLQVLIVKAKQDFLAQDIANRRIGSFARRNGTDRDIPVSNHAHEHVVLGNRQRAGIDGRHRHRCIADGLVRAGNADVGSSLR